MATHEFRLPDVGEGVAEGELLEWHVGIGDEVTEDQPLAEVETDKAAVEIPSPVDGVVTELRAEPGDMVPVGDVLVVIEVEGDDAEAAAADEGSPAPPEGRVFAAPKARRRARELGVDLAAVEGSGPGGRVTEADVETAAEESSTPAAEPTLEVRPTETEDASADEPDEPPEPPDAETAATEETEEPAEPATEPPERTEPEEAGEEPTGAETPAPEPGEDEAAEGVDGAAGDAGDGPAAREKTLAAPATRALARELDVDIDDVPATEDRDGQAFVSADAVRTFAEAESAPAPAAAPTEATPTETATPAQTRAGERVPYRGTRRTIGEHLEQSKFSAPHATHYDMVDVSALVETRDRLKPAAEERGVALTYTPFFCKAVAAVLPEYPLLNATLDEEAEEIVCFDAYHVGVAVATDHGLVVPVVEDVDEKSLGEVAEEIDALASGARDRSLPREAFQGSTFTVSNPGSLGGEYATPIINYPEVAILATGAIRKRPWVDDGEVVARETLPLSLSFDHRVVDGADAAQFVTDLGEYLTDPARLLLE